jgi:hypothetical protein
VVVSWSTVYYEPRPNSAKDLWRMHGGLFGELFKALGKSIDPMLKEKTGSDSTAE